jgi:MoxR-like ATPase
MHDVVDQVGRRIVGQNYMIERLLISILTGGHVLLEGVPGLAKTLAVRTLAERSAPASSASSSRPTCSPQTSRHPDLRSVERTVQHQERSDLREHILADEINRAPAKVQSALLEAMQEKQVTIGGRPTSSRSRSSFSPRRTHRAGRHLSAAEAQVDRFMLKLHVGYPTREEEKEILRRMASGHAIPVDM